MVYFYEKHAEFGKRLNNLMLQGDVAEYNLREYRRYLSVHSENVATCHESDIKTLGRPLDTFQLLDVFLLVSVGCTLGLVMLIGEILLRKYCTSVPA